MACAALEGEPRERDRAAPPESRREDDQQHPKTLLTRWGNSTSTRGKAL